MTDVVVSDNTLFDNEAGGVLVQNSLASATITNLHILGNTINQATNDNHGISMTADSGGIGAQGFKIHDNTIVGPASAAKYGINIAQSAGNFSGSSIRGNTVRNWARGLWVNAASDRDIGQAVVVDGNIFEDISVWAIGANIASGKYALFFNSTFINCTSEVVDASRVLAALNLGGGRVEVRRSAAPADGAWLVGDRVAFTAPTAGGSIGAVCTTAGSPGTWKNFGSISA